jgi:hypothetical protein
MTTSTSRTSEPVLKRLTGAEWFTFGALLVMALTIVLQIAGGADYPTIPPGLLLPLSSAALLLWRPNFFTRLYALANGLWIGFGAIVAEDVGDHLDSGSGLLVGTTYVQMVALVAIVAGAAMAFVQRRRAGRADHDAGGNAGGPVAGPGRRSGGAQTR